MHLKIGELSKKTSCSVLTIRFYEKEGLIPEPERTEGNYRLYDIGYVERIKFILNCRTLNMSLNEIRQLLTYKDNKVKSMRFCFNNSIACAKPSTPVMSAPYFSAILP